MVYVKCEADGTYKSSVDKFYDQADLANWAQITEAQAGDLILVLSGPANKTRAQLSALRMELGNLMGLRKPDEFAPLWLLISHFRMGRRVRALPRNAPPIHIHLNQKICTYRNRSCKVRANAYDMFLNETKLVEVQFVFTIKKTQALMFKLPWFTPEKAQEQFGFLMTLSNTAHHTRRFRLWLDRFSSHFRRARTIVTSSHS